MTVRLSTGARNGLASGLGFQGMFNKGYIEVYTGAQPVSGDAAKTGTLLGVVSQSSGALTKETRAVGTVTITAAAGGSIDTITVGGLNIIPDGPVAAVVGDTAATAVALASAINRNGMFQAKVAGSVVSINGRPGTGVTTAAVAGTLTTVTATYAAMAGGVAPVNGLLLGNPVAGVIARLSTQIWSFNGIADGTAGWFRMYGSDAADTGALISGAPYYPRIDGAIAVSGGDMNLSNIAIVTGSPNTVDGFSFTIPAA